MTRPTCPWCGTSFMPRSDGGKPQRFCSPPCRKKYHAGCRAWAEDRVNRGLLPISALKRALAQRTRSPEGDLSEG